jgi:hypothetical protein
MALAQTVKSVGVGIESATLGRSGAAHMARASSDAVDDAANATVDRRPELRIRT